MIGNQTHNQSIIVKEFSLEENYTAQFILVFIKTTLPEFEVIFKQSGIAIHKEDDISKELSKFFNDKARTQNLFFQFNEKKGVDFTIFVTPYKMGAQSIFMVEAKRLSKSHYDYVTGPTGGIERFKKEQDDFGVHLNYGAMIGYIQDGNHEYWHNRINSWIEDLINNESDIVWSKDDKLIPNPDLCNYISMHSRVSTSSITLFHYWISLS